MLRRHMTPRWFTVRGLASSWLRQALEPIVSDVKDVIGQATWPHADFVRSGEFWGAEIG